MSSSQLTFIFFRGEGSTSNITNHHQARGPVANRARREQREEGSRWWFPKDLGIGYPQIFSKRMVCKSSMFFMGYDASTCQKSRRHAKRVVPVDMPKKIVSVDMPKLCSRRRAKKIERFPPSTCQKVVPVDVPKKIASVDMPKGCLCRHAKHACHCRKAVHEVGVKLCTCFPESV